MRTSSSCLAFATLYGLILATNGIFMLVAPMAWYDMVPGVPATGPFNQHFLRDIGLIFVLLGGAVLVGVLRPPMRTVLWGAVTLWLAGHALFHVWEVLVGICAPSALARDFPAVSLPAIIAAALVVWAQRGLASAEESPVLT
ncbi:hypothetical protein [Methylobacterium oxalidis]|uniref:DUF4345 domain-containing protein n=1 Tax=Methylobacterium oxalidis TaxID=944322 RepID=A0A512JC95_9HYPH|nr:hypothetical protein [Methylobacterium oxalidis]GEP07594.1 hypothetical protein MOX02_56320 [Methylobacterium oxalidis]GJE34538.1 hypothetical protein LDDCCGHA_4750 [Methylobacterium oxalidis]GLS63435.1 hypothetical protein GCM10007888_18160 [Methylobacterium oxalidis]